MHLSLILTLQVIQTYVSVFLEGIMERNYSPIQKIGFWIAVVVILDFE